MTTNKWTYHKGVKHIFPVKDISHTNEDTWSDLVLLTSSLLRPDTCQLSEGPSHLRPFDGCNNAVGPKKKKTKKGSEGSKSRLGNFLRYHISWFMIIHVSGLFCRYFILWSTWRFSGSSQIFFFEIRTSMYDLIILIYLYLILH